MHQQPRLFSRPAENQAAARFMHRIREFLQSLQSRGINSGHISKAKNNDGRQLRQAGSHFVQLVGGAEKKWPMDTKDRHVIGNLLVLENVHVTFANVFMGYLSHRGCRGHLPYEDEGR